MSSHAAPPVQPRRRQEQISQGRRQILDATRALLRETTHYPAFSVDTVAKRADVARATVYYEFGSKTGLLEALCDDLAEAGQMSDLAQVFAEPARHWQPTTGRRRPNHCRPRPPLPGERPIGVERHDRADSIRSSAVSARREFDRAVGRRPSVALRGFSGSRQR